MDLPVELWMLVLESLTHKEHLARPAVINSFITCTLRNSATEEDLVRSLPAFERRAWLATRPYYAIDRRLRKAAQRVFLSGVILQTCSPPLDEVPMKRAKGKKVPRKLKSKASESESEKPFYVPSALAKMKPLADKDGELQPTYLALELFEPMVVERQARSETPLITPFISSPVEYFTLYLIITRHGDRLTLEENPLLKTARTVELLARPPDESAKLLEMAMKCAHLLKWRVEELWKAMRVDDGVVSIMD